MPARIPPETVKRFDRMLSDGYNVMDAHRACGVSKDWAYQRSKGRKKRDQAKFYATLDDAQLPPPTAPSNLSPEAARALVDFEYFRRRFTGRASMPWQILAAKQVLDLLESPQKEFVVINCPPGSGKSTLFVHEIPLWLICRNRAIRILIGSRTERQAKMYTGRLMDSLERTSPYLATDVERAQGSVDAESTVTADYGRFKPTTPKVWRREELTVAQPNDVAASDKENTLSAYGKDGGVLGGRFDLALWDDLVDPKNQGTADSRDELKKWWKDIAQTRIEPGGLMVLQGQRIGPDDLYRFALDMTDVVLDEDGFEVEQVEPPKKYKHILYKAHYEELCRPDGAHPRGTKAWPDGCLLDPYRLSWRDLASTKNNSLDSFLVGYQQEDTDPANVLVQKLWITGGRDTDGVVYPGCWDNERGIDELPKGLTGELFCYATADPSPSKFWGIQSWAYHPDTEQFFLLDLIRQKMGAPELLDWDADNGRFTGLMEQWQQRSKAAGRPISHWIIESNAAQRFLLQYDHVRRWIAKQGDVQVVSHQTNRNKNDAAFGVQMLGPLFRSGRVRLPGAQHDGARLASMKLIDEATRYPESNTDDQIMAMWFGTLGVPQLYVPTEARSVHRSVPRWVGRSLHAVPA